MDALAAQPIAYSSLEADEFDNLSGADSAGSAGDDDLEDEELDEGGVGISTEQVVKETVLQPRFEKWLAQLPAKEATRRDSLRELFMSLEVTDYSTEVESSMRTLALTFSLLGKAFDYRQISQADVGSAVWVLADTGKMELIPNVATTLKLNSEPLIECEHFAMGGGRERQQVDQKKLVELVGSDLVERLGGAVQLLQFLGALCADCEAPVGYSKAMPFGLPDAVMDLLLEAMLAPRAKASSTSAVARAPAATQPKAATIIAPVPAKAAPPKAATPEAPAAAAAAVAPAAAAVAPAAAAAERATPPALAIAEVAPASAVEVAPASAVQLPQEPLPPGVSRSSTASAGSAPARPPPSPSGSIPARPPASPTSRTRPSRPPASPSGVRPPPSPNGESARPRSRASGSSSTGALAISAAGAGAAIAGAAGARAAPGTGTQRSTSSGAAAAKAAGGRQRQTAGRAASTGAKK